VFHWLMEFFQIRSKDEKIFLLAMLTSFFITSHKLRRLVKRCFSLSEGVFATKGNELLSRLITGVTESLGRFSP
jgi:hypothetical protein